MTLALAPAYRSFGGEVEASSTPTICRLPDSRRHQLWAIALDADIRGFFDAMAHSWIIRFLEHRIAHKRILRLIAKWLKVGTVEDGRRTRGVCGAPQGAVISPILANVYLHYAFDLWVHRWRLTKASGDMIVIRYADDTIVGFQHEHEAQAFLDDLKERMRKFELALHPDKTRLIRFGRHAAKQREKRGEGKPETFDFLGFSVLQRHMERRATQCRKAA